MSPTDRPCPDPGTDSAHGASAILRRGLPPHGTVRVLTHNIYGHHARWPDRRGALVAGLRALRPDLVALQETMVTDAADQVAEILGDGYHVVHSRTRCTADGYGVSLASRWPVDAVHELDLGVTPRTADFVCTTLIAEIAVPEPVRPILFVNHFPNWQLNFER